MTTVMASPKEGNEELFSKGFYRHMKPSYRLLRKLNYAYERIGWKHADFPGVTLIFTTDYNKCVLGNLVTNSERTAYAYYNKEIVDEMEKNWDEQRITDLTLALQDWEPFKYFNQDIKRWSIDCAARVSAGLPYIPFTQNLLGCQWFLTTFLVDDPLENAMEKEEWWPAGQAFLEQFNRIYSGHCVPLEPLTMEGAGGSVPTKIVKKMEIALSIHQTDLEPQMRSILHPDVYKAACECAKDYGKNMELESKLFGQGLREKKYVDAYGMDSTRISTIGYFWIIPPLIYDPSLTNYVSCTDPLSRKFARICADDNDVISGPKDAIVEGRDFSPISRVHYLIQEAAANGEPELDFLSALRIAIQDSNRKKMELEKAMETMDEVRKKPYWWQYMLLIKLFDYHMVSGHDRPNDRYGWEPFPLDDDTTN